MKQKRPAHLPENSTRVFGFSLSFFFNKPLRTALKAAGLKPRFGWPRSGDNILIWGRKPTSKRGIRIANATGASLITAEDGFLRSVRTGRQGDAPLSLILDYQGIYFEPDRPNDLRDILRAGPALDAPQTQAATDGIALLRDAHLSKYNDFDLVVPDLPDRFVLVVDQTFGDASIKGAGADAGVFQQMLDAALAEHPNATILIKTHPETLAQKRRGYFDIGDQSERVVLFTEPVSPWILLDRARAVYCVSSQMGMEAIFAGHRPVVFGNAFYCGLGLTEDRHPAVTRLGSRSVEQLFHAAYVDYCTWVDPHTGSPSDFITTAQSLAAMAAFRRAHSKPKIFVGMRLWKRGFLRGFFDQGIGAPQFIETPEQAAQAAKKKQGGVYVWSGKETEALAKACAAADVPLVRVEDGFLRSAGLGAALVAPVSLALDDLGIYYDPTRESRLERLIAQNADLSDRKRARAEALRQAITALGLSKYNLKTTGQVELPKGRHLVLVPGQVEDDQSILKGTTTVATNLALLRQARLRFPDSFILYKPHPDVLAGLRDGGQAMGEIAQISDLVVEQADISALLDRVDCVATMTSLTGFESLLRGKSVVCYGAPFYAGWGLTEDLGDVPDRRTAQVSLEGLIHAALVDYPLYWDPVSGRPCGVETVLARFASGQVAGRKRIGIKALAKVQGVFASYAHLWR